ncbi:MAG: MCP four helix bundle domain-containing protein, partial [Armatimonadota bacterium]|nr:MCP four helix bundle domain-containing protein [Armatimonadota bacterium]
MKILQRLSMGQKFALAWALWLGLVIAYCLGSVWALRAVTRQTTRLYYDRLSPTQTLTKVQSDLAALDALVNSVSYTSDIQKSSLLHGYVPMFRNRLNIEMAIYNASYQESKLVQDQSFRTASARVRASTLFGQEGTLLIQWKEDWKTATEEIHQLSQPDAPASLNRQLQVTFGHAKRTLYDIASANDDLGKTQVDDAQMVAKEAQFGALALGLMALLGVIAMALFQQH